MSPIPGYQVIPQGWAQHHQPTANATMTAEGTIHRLTGGPPPYPKPVGWTGGDQIHAALFRVQELKREGGGTPGEQPTVERQYLITTKITDCPALQAGERGDMIHVLGRKFQIRSIMGGSLLWEVDLVCLENLTQQNPD